MLGRFVLRSVAVVVAFGVLAMMVSAPVSAQEKSASKETISSYLLISPHTAEECLAALDGVAASGEGALDKWYWGCAAGDHTGYEIVKASSEKEALSFVPEATRSKAKAKKLNKFTAEQVASFHNMK